jgi:hypothetical protein
MRKILLGVAALTLASCGGSSNAIYMRLVTAPSTSTCPGSSNGFSTTISNEGQLFDAAIYQAANNTALLDASLQGSQVLQGTQSGNTYTFTGKVIDDATNNQQIITQENTTVTLTVSGNSVTGTAVIQEEVNCESGCSGFTGDSNCTESVNFQGTIVPGVQNQTNIPPSAE